MPSSSKIKSFLRTRTAWPSLSLTARRAHLDSYSVPFARRAQNLGAEYLCYVLQFFGEGFVAYIEGTAHQRFSVVGDAVAVRVRDFGDEMVRPQ